MDPCPLPRPSDAGGDPGRHDRRRILHHDGGDDGGVAGRFHQDPGRCVAAYFGDRRAAPADAAAGGDDLCGSRISRPHARGAPSRHQESVCHHRIAADLGAGGADALGAVEGGAAICRPQPDRFDHRHRSPHRSRRLQSGDPHEAGHAEIALPLVERDPARRPAREQDRRTGQFQYHAGVRRRAPP